MKIEITDTSPPKKNETEFPSLMKSKRHGTVVLFSDATVGTCLSNPSSQPDAKVGRCDTDWKSCSNPNYWTLFTGTVTLSND